jgi:hypothetical protein
MIGTPASYSGSFVLFFGPRRDYFDRGFSWFFPAPPWKYRNSRVHLASGIAYQWSDHSTLHNLKQLKNVVKQTKK